MNKCLDISLFVLGLLVFFTLICVIDYFFFPHMFALFGGIGIAHVYERMYKELF